jgi:hypothetical protein
VGERGQGEVDVPRRQAGVGHGGDDRPRLAQRSSADGALGQVERRSALPRP